MSTESVATHVGVAAAASLGLDRCKVLPKETSLLVQAADLAGAEPILVEPLPDALAASARAIATFIKKNNLTEQLGTVFQHGPARHTERSIMFGVCSGQKSQQPFSASTGNYGVPAKTDKKVALKMELQKLLNAHGLLAAAEIQRTQPELYKKMARLRVLLGRHPSSQRQQLQQRVISHLTIPFSQMGMCLWARAPQRVTPIIATHPRPTSPRCSWEIGWVRFSQARRSCSIDSGPNA